MHSFEANNSSVPAFLMKLWKLVEDPECDHSIAWSDSGMSFVIKDQTRFSKELLPKYFKHNNMASFIRQLNMYGFRKVMNYEKSGLHNENDEMEFQHAFFCKDQIGLLSHIKRKIPNTKVSEPVVKSNARDILTDLSSIREKQENMDNMLVKMKQENELLWRELTNMRKKHKAQEHVIQKVIQFLVSIVQRSNQNIGVQRKMPPMLHDSSGNKGKSNVTCAIDVLRNKNPNFISVSADKLSPMGPVIHEVTEEEVVSSPIVKSPEERTENVLSPSNNENQESECPPISSLNSPINTSAMEPLSILEPLQPRTPALNADECTVEESVLGIPLEYISSSPCNVISIPEDAPCDNIISLPDSGSDANDSFNFNSAPNLLVYTTSSKSDFDDSLLSESLQTPKIPTIHIEDIYSPDVTSENKNEEFSEKNSANDNIELKEQLQQQNQQQSEHNYQLSVPDSSNVLKSPTLTKNTFSNHVLQVEENLNWLQDTFECGNWNFDANKLLGLFSADDVANNETLAGEIGAHAIKSEPFDIVGNELVQFTPSMLEVGMDMEDNHFLECLNQNEDQTGDASRNCEDQKNFLADVLVGADQAAASEAAEFLLNNGTSLKQKTPRRPKTQKLQKGKRRKIK